MKYVVVYFLYDNAFEIFDSKQAAIVFLEKLLTNEDFKIDSARVFVMAQELPIKIIERIKSVEL